MTIPGPKLSAFQLDFTFQDGVGASVCGFCAADRKAAVAAGFLDLETQDFGALTDGLLIDRRFAGLLSLACLTEDGAVFLLGGCVHPAGAQTSCGGVLGLPGMAPQSAREGLTPLTLPQGLRVSLLLRPGIGGAAFFCRDPREEALVARALEERFPQADSLQLLYEKAAGFLWILDFRPGDPLLNGRCLAYLPD